jgi:DNA-binding response OmpR family regulator
MALIIDGSPVRIQKNNGSRSQDRYLVIIDGVDYRLTWKEFRYLELLATRKLKNPDSHGWVHLDEFDCDNHNAHNHLYRLRKHIPVKIIYDGKGRFYLDYPAEGIEIKTPANS